MQIRATPVWKGNSKVGAFSKTRSRSDWTFIDVGLEAATQCNDHLMIGIWNTNRPEIAVTMCLLPVVGFFNGELYWLTMLWGIQLHVSHILLKFVDSVFFINMSANLCNSYIVNNIYFVLGKLIKITYQFYKLRWNRCREDPFLLSYFMEDYSFPSNG